GQDPLAGVVRHTRLPVQREAHRGHRDPSQPGHVPDSRRLRRSALLTRHGLAYGFDALLPPDRSGGTSLSAHPRHPPGRRPELRHGYQAVRQPMPGRHELATSRLSWLAIIPTCLAKIGGTWAWCSRATACSRTCPRSTTWASGCGCARSARASGVSGPATCWTWWAW